VIKRIAHYLNSQFSRDVNDSVSAKASSTHGAIECTAEHSSNRLLRLGQPERLAVTLPLPRLRAWKLSLSLFHRYTHPA